MLCLFSKIFAFDRDESRMSTMRSLLKKTAADCVSATHKDFRRVDPRDPKYKNVEYILVDPSCSGSGKSYNDCNASLVVWLSGNVITVHLACLSVSLQRLGMLILPKLIV